ncbi:uncharacterized protein LOC125654492 [Ostrea edulis]|uniref:uncharacterized protein LOC125654492 n=1 Tax=Ostrea edulis TaxID=37623 RepID=UPI0024AF9C2E|nr:uncharacterized protein LOC125654492 [Ostrea edulis]
MLPSNIGTTELEWYEVLMELHIKYAHTPPFTCYRRGWKADINDWYWLTGAINRSEDRRDLPTIPRPTHKIEWLARTKFQSKVKVPET